MRKAMILTCDDKSCIYNRHENGVDKCRKAGGLVMLSIVGGRPCCMSKRTERDFVIIHGILSNPLEIIEQQT